MSEEKKVLSKEEKIKKGKELLKQVNDLELTQEELDVVSGGNSGDGSILWLTIDDGKQSHILYGGNLKSR
jgi:hypothetical protein